MKVNWTQSFLILIGVGMFIYYYLLPKNEAITNQNQNPFYNENELSPEEGWSDFYEQMCPEGTLNSFCGGGATGYLYQT
tara:strand:- start:2 stop:238 length:237 start_codon:yes stop_codon:yes gene_type:complete